jgi:CCR4-NOT transcriptional regulation complex NOT5 subunit
MKKLHKAIIILIFIISLGANLYYFGAQELKKRELKAFNQGVVYTFQRASEAGEVSLKTEQGDITLTIKQ